MSKIIALVPRPFVPTPRQLQVLAARCAGGSRKDAAAILGISESTVRSHLRLLLTGAHCADDAQACFRFRREIAALMNDVNGASH